MPRNYAVDISIEIATQNQINEQNRKKNFYFLSRVMRRPSDHATILVGYRDSPAMVLAAHPAAAAAGTWAAVVAAGR